MCTQTINLSEWSLIDTALTGVSYRVQMFWCFKTKCCIELLLTNHAQT